jgi:hypothetical protein
MTIGELPSRNNFNAVREYNSFISRFLWKMYAYFNEEGKIPWYTLSDRLLKDIGETSADAEIEKLRRRWGSSV